MNELKNQIPESGEQLKKNKKNFNFQMPLKEVKNGFIADKEGTFNEVIEYSEFNNTLYPGKFQEGKRESVENIDEDTCMLITTCHADNLYSVTVVDNTDRDRDVYPPETHYPDEMYELFHQIQDKWNIKFPLMDLYPEQFKNNSIVLNKEQLLVFIDDMKLDIKEFFKDGEMLQSENDEHTYEKTEDGYEIKDVLPTQFLDTGTFRTEKVPLVEGNDGDIYMNAVRQDIEGKNVSFAGLDLLLENMKIVCMPDNYYQVQLTYKNAISRLYGKDLLNEISAHVDISQGDNPYGKLNRFTTYASENTKQQLAISEKWGIYTPLVAALNILGENRDESIIVDAEELQILLRDLGVQQEVILPTKSISEDKESTTAINQNLVDEKKRKDDSAEKIKIQEQEKIRKENAIGMMKHVLDGYMICNIDYIQDQKYILVRDEYSVKLVSRDMEYHKNIAEYLGVKKEQVMGGGKISIDEQNKTISIYDESTGFGGKISTAYHEIIINVLKTQYPEYSVQIQ